MNNHINEILTLFVKNGTLEAKLLWTKCWDPDGLTQKCKTITYQLSSISKQISQLKTTLQFLIDRNEIKYLTDKGEQLARDQQAKTEIRIEKRYRPPLLTYNNKAFINRSTVEIPEDIIILLSFGWKFISPYVTHNNNVHSVLAQIEKCIDDTIPPLSHHEAYAHIIPLLKDRSRIEADSIKRWLIFVSKRTELFFKNNKNIFATRSDKGSHTVVIDTHDYDIAISNMLNNDAYTLINNNNESNTQCLITPLITKEFILLKKLSLIPRTAELISKGYQPNTLNISKFYGLLKVHKSDFALRPIVSMTNAPGHALGTTFNSILTRVLPRSDYHVKDSYSIKEFIDKTKINHDSKLVSFDVVSMYTNIPRYLAKEIILKNQRKFFNIFQLNSEILIEILDFLLTDCVVFATNSHLYKQNKGLPMGGCISTALARIVMDEVMNHLFSIIPNTYIDFIKIFVDDTLAAIHKDYITPTLNALNCFHEDIKFTIENENDLKSINFLNITITREGQVMFTNWYRKSFASGRLLNFYSSHKRSTIINTAVAFINTILTLSDVRFFHNNKEIATQTLRDNSFPETTIINLMNKHYSLMKLKPPGKTIDNIFKIFPQAICNSRKIKNVIHTLKHNRFVLADSSKNTKINFVRTIKAPIPPGRRSNVIVISKCVCGLRIKIRSTTFNQNVNMLTRKLLTSFKTCNGLNHAHIDFSIKKGLCYQDQTNYLLTYLKFLNRDKIDADELSLPNFHLTKLLPKTKRRHI